jgi:acetyl-CoA acetyltransferase
LSEAVIVSACRTAIGTARKGSLVDSDPFALARHVVEEALSRSQLDPEIIDDVILGESLAGGGDIARYAAIEAGIGSAPGVAINRHCASGLSAIAAGAASVRAGMDQVVIAGGVHSSSLMPRTRRRIPGTDEWDETWMSPSHPDTA